MAKPNRQTAALLEHSRNAGIDPLDKYLVALVIDHGDTDRLRDLLRRLEVIE